MTIFSRLPWNRRKLQLESTVEPWIRRLCAWNRGPRRKYDTRETKCIPPSSFLPDKHFQESNPRVLVQNWIDKLRGIPVIRSSQTRSDLARHQRRREIQPDLPGDAEARSHGEDEEK